MEFQTKIKILGVNPYVEVPKRILAILFKQAGKDKGPIPICGQLNGQPYRQTLVKYRGDWRLYVNTKMLKGSPKKIGEAVRITVEFDALERKMKPHPKMEMALKSNPVAKNKFDNLPPSRQLEIVRYISFLKTEESVDRNVIKAIDFLLGKGRFVGRDRP